MDTDFLVPTGSIIKEYLEVEGMNQKEFSKRLGMSEKHVSNLLNGKSRLTEEVAIKIEKIIKNVPASYWLNYEAEYREYLVREESKKQYSPEILKEIARRFNFSAVFKGLNWDLQKQANEMLKILRIADFESFDSVYKKLAVDFMEDGGEREAIAVWLGLAREEVSLQNNDISEISYNQKKLEDSLEKLKYIALNSDYEKSLKSARKLLNKLGINLVICEPIVNGKVRGALSSYENKPVIYLSGRFKTHDHIWFALMHEIGHLIMHYNPIEEIISFEEEVLLELSDKEIEANKFARDFFIHEKEYNNFIKKKSIHNEDIEKFAQEQNILPGILVARLQHDGLLGFDQLNKFKNR